MLAESTELVQYSRATEIATKYAAAVADIRRLLGELGTAMQALAGAFESESVMNSDFEIEIKNHQEGYKLDEKGIDELTTEFKRSAWRCLVEKLSIKKLMSSADRDKLDEQLNMYRQRRSYHSAPLPDLPEIDADTIVSVLQGFVASAPDYFAAKVSEVWKWLIPSQWQGGHVTNARDRVAKKVIRTWVVERGYGGKKFHVRYQIRGEVNSLDSIFHTLDGKGVLPGHEGPLVSAVATSEDGTGETEYFRFKCFKNGNLHIEFKRDDLLQQFNQIAADGHRIGASRK